LNSDLGEMKRKTEIRLSKKKEMLPLHGQDSNIVIGAITGGKRVKECERYLARLGNIYRGVLPLPACGEVDRFIFTKLSSHEERMRFFGTYAYLVDHRKIEISVPRERSHKIYRELIQIDSRVFVTLDDDLIEHKAIERRFKIKIKQPGDLL